MSLNAYSTNNTTTTSSAKTFRCPIGHCGVSVNENSRAINQHILSAHPKVAHAMQITPNKYTYICKTCDKYTPFIHFHCHSCTENTWFKSRDELNAHLKVDHAKWYTETACKHVDKCYGHKNGQCGFNHKTIGIEYAFDVEKIELPFGFCKYDKPWEGKRCMRTQCSFDHFRGRVKFILHSKEKPSPVKLPIAPSLLPVDVDNTVMLSFGDFPHVPASTSPQPESDIVPPTYTLRVDTASTSPQPESDIVPPTYTLRVDTASTSPQPESDIVPPTYTLQHSDTTS